MPGVKFLAVSRYRETRPVGGPAGQDSFLNGACLIETELPPRDVLGMLAAVENTLHRERQERWGPRTIDLDLLLYDDLVMETAELTVPHPRMATRRFVLEPSAEIAGGFAYPPSACTIGDLLDNISVPSPLVAVVGVPGSGTAQVAAGVADALMARLVECPAPLPQVARLADWRQTIAAWAEPLARDDWHDEPHGTVADYWFDTLAIASDALALDDRAAFDRDLARAAAGIVSPQVAIALVADAAKLDVGTARLQERILRRLRCPSDRSPGSPKAVIVVDARDLARATADATAAVEAML